MSAKYALARGPWTSTTPATLSALDLSANVTDFRPTKWLDREDRIFEQEFENDFAYIAFLQMLDVGQKFILDQPVAKWRVGRPADMETTNDVAIAAADLPGGGVVGYISLAESLLVEANYLIHFVDYGVQLRVIAKDDDNSEGWQNAATTACNVKVERLSGPAVAIPAGTICHIGSAIMGELGTPSPSVTTTPGEPVFNTMQLVALKGSIGTIQMNTNMAGMWGTHEKVRAETWYQHLLHKQYDLLFGQRHYGTDSQGAQGQLWLSAGIVPQVKTNVLSAGNRGVNLTWDNLNEFWEGTFNSELSAGAKDHFCGSAQFRDIRRQAQQYGAMEGPMGIQSGVQNAQTLGANTMTVRLQSGKIVRIHELRRAFKSTNLSDWGITVDKNNIRFGTFKGWEERWVENLETPEQAITLRSDAVVDTWITCVIDESTMGVVRGGSRALLER